MAKKVLITGAFGLLGEAVVKALEPNFQLLATGENIPVEHPYICDIQSLDIIDKIGLKNVIHTFQPDIVVNLAAYTNVDGCESKKELAWNINVKGVQNILESIRRSQTKIIQISTDYVFDGNNGPYNEEVIPNPINYYGRTKLASENEIRGSQNPHVIFRTNVLFGNSTRNKPNFVDWIVKSLKEKNEIKVVTDQINNPAWTNGLAEAVKLAILLDVRGLFNYGGSEFLNRFDFAQKIASVFELDQSTIKPILTKDLNQAADRPLKSGLLTEKIEETFGLRLYNIEYCLKKMKEGITV